MNPQRIDAVWTVVGNNLFVMDVNASVARHYHINTDPTGVVFWDRRENVDRKNLTSREWMHGDIPKARECYKP